MCTIAPLRGEAQGTVMNADRSGRARVAGEKRLYSRQRATPSKRLARLEWASAGARQHLCQRLETRAFPHPAIVEIEIVG